jgi:hypothetical protein
MPDFAKQVRKLLDPMEVALDYDGSKLRFNFQMGNDGTWQEIAMEDGKSIEEAAAIINNAYRKHATGSSNEKIQEES